MHGRWRGGRYYKDGYVMILCADGKYRREHRLIAEKKIGRRLRSCEVVHHINGVRDDNRPMNLDIMTVKLHARTHGPAAANARWANSAARMRQAKTMVMRWAHPTARERQRVLAKRRWRNQGFRARYVRFARHRARDSAGRFVRLTEVS